MCSGTRKRKKIRDKLNLWQIGLSFGHSFLINLPCLYLCKIIQVIQIGFFLFDSLLCLGWNATGLVGCTFRASHPRPDRGTSSADSVLRLFVIAPSFVDRPTEVGPCLCVYSQVSRYLSSSHNYLFSVHSRFTALRLAEFDHLLPPFRRITSYFFRILSISPEED